MNQGRRDRAWSARTRLRPNAWYVLCELTDVDHDIVAVSSRELAVRLRLGRDTVRAALRELEHNGLIVPSVVRGDGGRFGSRAYVVLPAPAASRPAPEYPPPAPRPRRAARATTAMRANDSATQLSFLSPTS